jgi:hypothetical protein
VRLKDEPQRRRERRAEGNSLREENCVAEHTP